jgi:hypothetical protein
MCVSGQTNSQKKIKKNRFSSMTLSYKGEGNETKLTRPESPNLNSKETGEGDINLTNTVTTYNLTGVTNSCVTECFWHFFLF